MIAQLVTFSLIISALSVALSTPDAADREMATGTAYGGESVRKHVQDIIFTDDVRVAGTIEGETIVVPYGVTVTVEANCEMIADRFITIQGRIVVESVDDLVSVDAPDLRISAGRRLTVNGAIVGGRGRTSEGRLAIESAGLDGGDGSDLHLSAPDYLVRGLVVAGHGGDAGRGGAGGNGGWVFETGRQITDLHPASPHMVVAGETVVFGGGGGRGGDSMRAAGIDYAGRGGNGGGILCQIHADDFQRPAAGALGEGEDDDEFVSGVGFEAAPCMKGDDGKTPDARVGGPANYGGHGEDGTADSPDGIDGAPGGDAADVTGMGPQPGQNGAACCGDNSGTGGDGGKGGQSGSATAKAGGLGGDGGTAFRTVFGQWMGKGGKAGNGGKGGSAFVLQGAKGGDGGIGTPGGNGGDGGSSGTPTFGVGGAAGTPGAGSPHGGPGTGGSAGSPNGGGWGQNGTDGGHCPQ